MAVSLDVTCFAVANIQIQEVSDQVEQLWRKSFKFPGSLFPSRLMVLRRRKTIQFRSVGFNACTKTPYSRESPRHQEFNQGYGVGLSRMPNAQQARLYNMKTRR